MNRRLSALVFLAASAMVVPARAQESPKPAAPESTVTVTGTSQVDFPKIGVQFELRGPDGTFVRNATREEFRVTEEGKDRPILDFQAPVTTERTPTKLVLVVDRSGSMKEDDRIGALKEAVSSFLDKLPAGSEVAVIAFSTQIRIVCPFTKDREEARRSIERIYPDGATRFYDAVAQAIALMDRVEGRHAVIALTDGQDTSSLDADLSSTIRQAKQNGVPVYTLGLGPEDVIAVKELRELATATRGQYYPAQKADQLKAVYETIAERLGAGYTLTYQTDRRIPDGTLRPVQVFHRGSTRAGESAVFIPGMVVPAPGWSPLFLFLTGGLAFLAALPSRMRAKTAGERPA